LRCKIDHVHSTITARQLYTISKVPLALGSWTKVVL
jgi:hypothetical protein